MFPLWYKLYETNGQDLPFIRTIFFTVQSNQVPIHELRQASNLLHEQL